MADPVTMAIACAAVGKVSESLTDQARQAVAAIVRRINDKFRRHPPDLAALEAAKADPALISQLADRLDRAMAEDPAFGRELRALWAHTNIEASDGGVANVFRGHAEKVVQLRDAYGDININ